jgi:two-component system OmpR family response regulator/two-component system response regulator QseB
MGSNHAAIAHYLPMKILLAEDDLLLGDGLRAGLRQQGFVVDWVRDGVAAERELPAGEYQAVVLDLGLPLLDGVEVLRRWRARRLTTPVLVLTARDAVSDRVQGLDVGADDYVVKPVDLQELAARLRALVRRAHGGVQDELALGELSLWPSQRRVVWQGAEVTLSTREFDLLHALARNPRRVLTREQLQQQLYSWG